MRTNHALFVIAFVVSIVARSRPITLAEQEPPNEAAAREPCAGGAPSEKAVEIPLKEIWGQDRPLRKLEPDKILYRDTPEKIRKWADPEAFRKAQENAGPSLVLAIEKAMSEDVLNLSDSTRREDAKPAPGFVVRGKERSALPGIYRVIVCGDQPRKKFLASDNITLVFFSLATQPAIKLTLAERLGAKIDIRYAIVPRAELSIHWSLRLIDLGKLPCGNYQISFIRDFEDESRLKQRGSRNSALIAKNAHEYLICKDFQFSVAEVPSSNHKDQQ